MPCAASSRVFHDNDWYPQTTVGFFFFSKNHFLDGPVSWSSRGPDSSGEVWIGCKILILKLSKVLLAMEVEGPYMHTNRRLILI